ncbi:MAG TPA: hypothetical protein VHZ95_01330, partial [Polyangiales bacterium]|nr:hypothetical protein [Polyangiales bacterium]
MRAGERGGWLVVLVCTLFAAPSAEHLEAEETSESPARATASHSSVTSARRDALIAQAPGAHAVIVSVPNPEHIHTAVYFDEAIESLIGATQDAGWETVGHWLPWHVRETADKHASACTSLCQVERDEKSVDAGVIGFKKNTETLTVFLIDESEVSGIDRAMLANALEELRSKQYVDATTPRVLGPFFSGSARSLFEVLDATPNLSPRVVTGSATARGLESLIKHGSFSRAINDDRQLSRFVREQLPEAQDERIATLTEESTRYGAGLSHENGQYFFPLHIAQVASEHARESKSKSESTSAPRLKHMLTLQFDD